jgi:Cof subfamily protein (haloacid dehalogenase superfamily)
MKPIYITDLDHTFLRTDQTISDFSVRVWNEKSGEAILSIATARSYQKSMQFLSQLHLDAPMILLDGTMVVTASKKAISLKTMNKALGDAIITEGKLFDIYPFIITLNDIKTLDESFLFPSQVNPYQTLVLENYTNDPRMKQCKEIKSQEMNLKFVYFGAYETLHPLSLHLRKTFGNELEYKISPEGYSNAWFLTVLHPEGDKANALSKVLEYLGREASDVTVFGDSLNDIGMFKLAGKAIAVSNALDEVKAVSDIVLPHSNDEDAVAKYLMGVD